MHTASAGLRILADELDALAADGTSPNVEVQIRLTRDQRHIVCERLQLDPEPIAESRGAYDMFRATRNIGALEIRGWNWLGELCEKRTVTRQVEVWTCGDDEFEVKP